MLSELFEAIQRTTGICLDPGQDAERLVSREVTSYWVAARRPLRRTGKSV